MAGASSARAPKTSWYSASHYKQRCPLYDPLPDAVSSAQAISIPRERLMKVTQAIARVLKTEGVEFLIGYPVNPIIESAAEADIRTIMVRQERIGLHMCDAIAKVTSGDRIGVFAMQHGPGTENAFGGVAQSYGDSCPVVVLPAGYARNVNQVRPNFNAALNFRHVTKWIEQVTVPGAT